MALDRKSRLVSNLQIQLFRQDLVSWFETIARDLPWRRTRDPYHIWVSEVMLQQTRVEQAIPYYRRFISAFPTVEKLAEADIDAVLRNWEGLGYYARARNLHRAARDIVEKYEGWFPTDYQAARKLPGVGAYTAAAVLSIAYNQPLAAVDGNIARVLSRVFMIEQDIRSTQARKKIQELSDRLLHPEAPGNYNEAMMELGAMVCTPRAPSCHKCPLRDDCLAFQQGEVQAYPVTKPRPPLPHYAVAVALIFDEAGQVLIQQRPADGLLGGLWEFPGGKQEKHESLEEACRREIFEELGIEVHILDHFYRLKHSYTHFKVTIDAFRCRIHHGSPASKKHMPIRWVPVHELHQYAFPRANRRLIEALVEKQQSPYLF